MKMYHFKPEDCGKEYFVMSVSRFLAYYSLLNYFEKKINEFPDLQSYKNSLKDWIPISIDNEKELQENGYSIKEYSAGEVVESEIC